MSTGSSGCVLKNLFTCEKKCNSVASRKALLEDFTSKIYNAEVVFVDNDGKTAEEEYGIVFILSENQKDSEMIRVHGNAYIKSNLEDPLIKASWSAIYLEKKHGYKMRLSGDNIEKEFYLYCDGNDEINFSVKKTASGDTSVRQLSKFLNNIRRNGLGKLGNLELKLKKLYAIPNSDDKITTVQQQIMQLSYDKYNKIPTYLIDRANLLCGCDDGYYDYNFCQDKQLDPYEQCFGDGDEDVDEGEDGDCLADCGGEDGDY